MSGELPSPRFARHVMLREIGERGQQQLLEGRARFVGEPAGVAHALEYTTRAGLRATTDSDAPPFEVLRCDALTQDPALREAAHLLAGALASVEAIKAVVGCGAPLDPRRVPRLDGEGGAR